MPLSEGPLRALSSPPPAADGEVHACDPGPVLDGWEALDVPVVVLDVDPDGALRWAAMNPAQERALGVPFEALRGHVLREASGLALEEWLVARVTPCASRGEAATFEPEHPDPATGRWVARAVTPLRDASGAVRRLVVAGRDVTDEHRLAALLAQATRMDAVGRAAGTAAREFNNLMVAISGYAGLVLKSLAPGAKAREHLAGMIQLTETASALTRQVLAFSHRQQGVAVLVRVDELAADLAPVLQRLLRDNIALTVRRAPDLWRVKADPHQLEQALVHLAARARDAMPRGGAMTVEAANVSLTREEAHRLGLGAGEHVLVTVGDTGAPLDAQSLQRALDPQPHSAPRTDAELGLAACHGIVRQLGGAMTAASAPGAGTTFSIHLPRSVEKSAVSGVSTASAPLRGHETVLVADAGVTREAAVRTLRMLGYTVLDAATVGDAVRIVEEHGRAPIDLVVLGGGATLPTSLALLRAVHGLHGPVPVLATGAADAWATPSDLATVPLTALPTEVAPTTLARRVRSLLDARGRRGG